MIKLENALTILIYTFKVDYLLFLLFILTLYNNVYAQNIMKQLNNNTNQNVVANHYVISGNYVIVTISNAAVLNEKKTNSKEGQRVIP